MDVGCVGSSVICTVRGVIEGITTDLRYAMAMTASPDVSHIDPSIVRLAKHTW